MAVVIQEKPFVEESTEPSGEVIGYFMGFKTLKTYPAWRYHEVLQPKIVNNTQEDQEANDAGWKAVNVPMGRNPQLLNWHWDLEDFSAKQMVLFAKEEFNIELPFEAGVEKLFKVIWDLTKSAPANENRIILMAQTIKMEYDETLEEIKRLIETEPAEVTVEEFYA